MRKISNDINLSSTQMFSMCYTNQENISKIIEYIKRLGSLNYFNCYIKRCKCFDDYQEKIEIEKKRTIGFSKGIRITLYTYKNDNACLILTANSKSVPFLQFKKIFDKMIYQKELTFDKVPHEYNATYSNNQNALYSNVNLDGYKYNLKKIKTSLIQTLQSYTYNKDKNEIENYINQNLEVVSTSLEKNCDYDPCVFPRKKFEIIVSTKENIITKFTIKTLYDFKEKEWIGFISLFEQIYKSSKEISNDKNCIATYISKNINYKENLFSYWERIVLENSSKIAVSDTNTNFILSYKELDKLSDTIANNLIKNGVKESDKVVISVTQNSFLIPIILGVVKCGATYVPVDPNYPLKRISYIIDDSKAQFVITDRCLNIKDLNVLKVKNLIDKNTILKKLNNYRMNKAKYIIYTSGTTGKPKGVEVPLKNVLNLVLSVRNLIELKSSDVWSMFHSYSFDFSVWEMWGCLLNGAHLVVISRDIAKSTYDFYNCLIKNHVTILNQTPSAFFILSKIDNEYKEKLDIRLIIFGGEKLNGNYLTSWFERHPSSLCKVFNMYGITETTVHATYRQLTRKNIYSDSIGKGLPGWNLSIRKDNGAPCLYGMKGEIWVSGVGITNGYLNLKKLNKEKFVKEGDHIWYRSGDLGLMHPNGDIDYCGRIDNQVKIRGYRIELNEILNAIENITNVESAFVTVKNGNTDLNKEIIAYFKGYISKDKINQNLQKLLPSYMIPSQIIKVKEFPTTLNGKIDKEKLLEKNDFYKEKKESNKFISIWSNVLKKNISANDHFFDVGGNSLLAVELLSTLHHLGYENIKLKDIYVNSSPEEMEKFIKESKF